MMISMKAVSVAVLVTDSILLCLLKNEIHTTWNNSITYRVLLFVSIAVSNNQNHGVINHLLFFSLSTRYIPLLTLGPGVHKLTGRIQHNTDRQCCNPKHPNYHQHC